MKSKHYSYLCSAQWVILCFLLTHGVIYSQIGQENPDNTVPVGFTHDGVKTKSALFANTTKADSNASKKYWRQLIVTTDNEIIAVSPPAEDHSAYWSHNHPGNDPFINPKPSSVTFDNKQVTNAYSKKYNPTFSGETKKPSGNGGNGLNTYTWTVNGEYTIKCTEKCGKIDEDVEVPIGYDMAIDKLHIKPLFENLLHYSTENCDCEKHTISFPATITADFEVKCNHFGNLCEKLGEIKAVDVDFYLEVTPDVLFQGRSKSRLGLLEKATVVAKSVTDDSIVNNVTFSLVSGGDSLSCTPMGILTAKTVVGFGKVKGTRPSGKTSTTLVGVVKPNGMEFYEDERFSRLINNRQELLNYTAMPLASNITDVTHYICGFRHPYILLPEDVSFNKLKIKEINIPSVADLYLPPPQHDSEWNDIPIPKSTEQGQRLGDRVTGVILKSAPTPRYVKYQINWVFCDKVDTTNEIASFIVVQTYSYSESKFTVSKANKSHAVP